MHSARLPFRATRDLADAERVLAAHVARVRPLLDAADKQALTSANANFMRALCALDAALRGGRCRDADAADSDWVSTRTPTPIVLDNATLRR